MLIRFNSTKTLKISHHELPFAVIKIYVVTFNVTIRVKFKLGKEN